MKKKTFLPLLLSAMLVLSGLPVTQVSAASFTDIQGHWAEESINRAVDAGLFVGVSDSEFDPEGTMTRAMFVTVLAKYNGYQPENYTSSSFNDVPAGSWYAPAVQWAHENRIVSGTSKTNFSPEQAVSRQQIAVILINYSNYTNIVLPRIRAGKLFSDSAQCEDYALDAVYTLYRSGIINGMSDSIFGPKQNATRAQCASLMCSYMDTCKKSVAAEHRIALINHRGYNTVAPENTLPAYELSAQKGYSAVETDVQFTKDNMAVLLHDSTIDRTSNGSGSVASMTYSQLQAYDFGSWKSAAYAGTKIPTFESFISLCRDRHLRPYIELKSVMTDTQVKQLVSIVRQYSMLDNVTWISFYNADLSKVSTYCSTAELDFLVLSVSNSSITTANKLKNGKNHVFLGISLKACTTGQRAACLRSGLDTAVWTVDGQSDAVSLANSSVLSITTDSILQENLYS